VPAVASSVGTTVQTEYGPVVGVSTASGMYWKGIPYAEPPMGANRWMPTKRIAQPWTTPRAASKFGNACPQMCHLPPGACGPVNEISEDCLFLNVYAPPTTNTSASDALLPVMVWIHGGRFEQGSGGVNLYDGTILSRNGPVVVVTINYRLGVLGFFVNEDSNIKGNFAIQDQQQSLEWVKANIKGFGGDPDKVTIFGQSAGGASMLSHMMSPASWPLFHQVVVQSAPVALPVLSNKEADKHYEVFVKDTSCHHKRKSEKLDCLRSINWQGVVAAQSKAQGKIFLSKPLSMFEPWSPTVDGVVLPGTFLDLLKEGRFSRVPLVIGHVTEEARMFVYEAFTKSVSKTEADALVRLIWQGKDVAKQIFKMYPWPSPAPKDYRDWFSELGTDFVIECPSRHVANLYANKTLPVHRYEFNHVWETRGLWGKNMSFCEGHVCHGGEMPYVFDSANISLPGKSFLPDEFVLAKQMVQMWTSFAVSSTPAAEGAAAWPLHKGTQDEAAYRFQTTPPSAPVVGDRTKYCDFWDRLGYNYQ